MRTVRGKVVETHLESGGKASLRIACPEGMAPHPGQYISAANLRATDDPLATSLFSGGLWSEGFIAAPPVPPGWEPGTDLLLTGPLGSGFQLPPTTRRLALAALDGSPARLVPLIETALASGLEAALFTGGTLSFLPSALEVHPLEELKESLDWADFLAVDLSLTHLGELRACLGIELPGLLPVPAQVLIYTPMPCRGIALCGVCAVPGRRKRLLACEDGPVFELMDLEW